MLSANAALTFCLQSKAYHQCRAGSALLFVRVSSLSISGCTVCGLQKCVSSRLQSAAVHPAFILRTKSLSGHTGWEGRSDSTATTLSPSKSQLCKAFGQCCPNSCQPFSRVMPCGHWSCRFKTNVTKTMLPGSPSCHCHCHRT